MPARTLTLTAVLSALLCLLGPLTLPAGPVPLSLTTALLYCMAILLGARQACLSCGLYLLLGLAGLPVFSGFTGGVGVLAGPTGGFLLGYLPMTALCGAVCGRTGNRWLQGAGFAAGTALLYVCGTAWYAWITGASAASALAVCVLPFLPGDAFKIFLVLTFGNLLSARLKKAGMLKQGGHHEKAHRSCGDSCRRPPL